MSNCLDKSDELNCRLLFIEVKSYISLTLLENQKNYNKKIPPFAFDKENNVNIPVNINVSMSIIDILKFEEIDHVYNLKFRLVLEWYLFIRNSFIYYQMMCSKL